MAGIISTESSVQPESSTERVYRRDRRCRAGVYWADRIARAVITIGGIGTIIVVLLVVLVLLGNVLPLFQKSSLNEGRSFGFADVEPAADVGFLAFGVDEYSELIWLVRPDQSLDVFCLSNGEHLQRILPAGSPSSNPVRATVAKVDDQQTSVLLGLQDGTVRIVLLGIDVSYTSKAALEPGLVALLETSSEPFVLQDQTIYRSTSEG